VTDFSGHPKTISEIRSEKSSKGSDWTPRDVLISMLRDIDAGTLKPDALIVCYRHSGNKTSFRQATPDALTMLGLLERTKFRIHEVAGQ
jgi:hypothetical protein